MRAAYTERQIPMMVGVVHVASVDAAAAPGKSPKADADETVSAAPER